MPIFSISSTINSCILPLCQKLSCIDIKFTDLAFRRVHGKGFHCILTRRWPFLMSQPLRGTFTHPSVAQSCPTLCDAVNWSLPGSPVHGILQARILEWAAVSFSRGSSQSSNWTWVSHIADRFFTDLATKEAYLKKKKNCCTCKIQIELVLSFVPAPPKSYKVWGLRVRVDKLDFSEI